MLRNSKVCAIDFPNRRRDRLPCFGAAVMAGAALKAEDNSGEDFLFESAVTL
jgi:hypothetical protein